MYSIFVSFEYTVKEYSYQMIFLMYAPWDNIFKT